MTTTIQDVWDNANRMYPSIVYIETTNICNAKCVCCLNHRCEKPRGTMSYEAFVIIADKIKERRLKIGAMFCFGEPLLDESFIEKFGYAKKIDAFTQGHIGFKTNVSHLTAEKYDGLLNNTSNITLSFFNTGNDYERLTGNLKWPDSYKKAIDFIRYRDKHAPDYPIFIGVNKINGHNLANVKEAFKGYRVMYAQDAELRWGGKVITGVLDRMVMYPDWRCDGYKGALQVKYDGSCEFCAYDIIGTDSGGETKFANILTDSWEDINSKFKEKFGSGCSLCKRCDYWHHAKDIINNNFKRPLPLPENWNDWQIPYVGNNFEV